LPLSRGTRIPVLGQERCDSPAGSCSGQERHDSPAGNCSVKHWASVFLGVMGLLVPSVFRVAGYSFFALSGESGILAH
jgi:hypothetical protein